MRTKTVTCFFTVKLKKSKMTVVDSVHDCIVGTYAITQNGITLTDNMEKFANQLNPYTYPISGLDYNEIYNQLKLVFTDELYDKFTGNGTLALIPSKNGKFNLQWILKEDEGDHVYNRNEVIPPSGFSVPR